MLRHVKKQERENIISTVRVVACCQGVSFAQHCLISDLGRAFNNWYFYNLRFNCKICTHAEFPKHDLDVMKFL